MEFASLSRVVRRTLFQLGDEGIDVQLVERFIEQCDQDAFAELVRRHGPMVMGVCRRVLGHAQDAEDAFQATFVILARKAARIAEKKLLGGWLHGVAYHVAMEARKRGLRERTRGQPNGEEIVRELPEKARANTEPTLSDLRAVLDEELQRLPEKCRAALVLCYLEGKTNRDAARILGYSTSWVEKKLIKGRGLLRSRLAKRGMALTELALVALLVPDRAWAALSPPLLHLTAQVALGQSGAPVAVTVLVEAGLHALARNKVRSWAALAVTVLIVTVGVTVTLAVMQKPTAEAPPDSRIMQVRHVFEGHTDFVNSAALAPDGRTLVSGSQDGTVRLWNIADGQTRHVLQSSGPRVLNAPWQLVAFSPDGKMVASSNTDHQVCLWDPETGKQLRAHYVGQGRVLDLAFSADGQQVAAVSWNAGFYSWSMVTGQELRNPNFLAPHGGTRHATVAPDGRGVALANTWESHVFLYDAASASDRVVANTVSRRVVANQADQCNRLRFSPDARSLAIGMTDGSVTLWDVATGRERAWLRDAAPVLPPKDVNPRNQGPMSSWVMALRFSADGRRLAVGTGGGRITIWDVTTGQPCARCWQAGDVVSLDFSADGQTLVSADGSTINLWK